MSDETGEAFAAAMDNTVELAKRRRTLQSIPAATVHEIAGWTMGHYLFLLDKGRAASDFDTWVSAHDEAIKADYARMLTGSHERETEYLNRAKLAEREIERLLEIIEGK